MTPATTYLPPFSRPDPAPPARRAGGGGGEAGGLVPGRPGGGAGHPEVVVRERIVHGPLPRGAVRPVGGALHRDRELPPEHPGTAARPARDRELRGLHRAREA